jgi:hypothetical protein
MPRRIFIFVYFCRLSLSPPNELKTPPKHVPPQSRAITDVISIERRRRFGWLLCPFI